MFSAPEVDVVVEPFPVKDRVAEGFDAFDVNVTLPVTLPLAVGVKEMFNGRLLPGAMVMGNWPGRIANSELSTVAAEIVRFPPFEGPELVIVTVLVVVVLFFTEPKSSGDGKVERNGDATCFWTTWKSALTFWAAVILTVQVVEVPVHAPDHPLKVKPLRAVAVSVTDVP